MFFERLRDEVREGKSLRPAVESGWKRARRTILVSDTVSFLAALLLWYFSISDVKGFAFTLGLTTLIDVIVVFLFTKPMVTMLAKTKFFSSGHPLSGLDPARLGRPGARGGRRLPAAPATRRREGGMMARLGEIAGRLYRGEVSVNFVGRQRLWYTISGLILLISIVALVDQGAELQRRLQGRRRCSSSPRRATTLTQLHNVVPTRRRAARRSSQAVGTGGKLAGAEPAS